MSFSSTFSSSSSSMFLQSTTSSDLHPPLRRKRPSSSSSPSSSVSSNILSCINLVSILSVLINLVFCFLLVLAIVNGQKTERIIESHHQHPVVVVDSSNRPRFRNGTLFQFGGGGGGGGSGRFRTSSQQQATSLDQFGNRIINNNNDNNFVPGAVIHVSNRVNVLDTDSGVGNDGDRTLTDNSWIHREDSSAAIQRIPSGHQSRPDVIRYKVIKLDGGPNRTIVNGDQRFSHRTNLDAYHRAAAGLDEFVDDSGRHGAHPDGGGGIVLEEFGRASSTASEGGGGGHRNHVDISHDRFETGSIGAGGVSGGQGSLTGHQNRVIVGPVNRTLIRAGGLGHGGHQNRIIVGPLNRTFIHDGPGGQTIHSIHRDRIINVVPINRTNIGHHSGSALGHQDHVIVARPLNRTLIHDSGSGATYLRADGGNRTFVHSGGGGGGNVRVHSNGGGQQDHRTNVVGAINRTSLIHTGSGLQNQSVFHHHHVGSGLNRTSYIQPGSTVGHGSGGSSHSAAINQTFPISGGYQNRTTIGGLNRTQIQSGSIAGSVVNAANNLAAIGPTINRQRFDDRSQPVAGLGTAVEYETRDRVAVGSGGTRTQAEMERESVAPGTRLANIRAGPAGTSGQAVQLSQLDNVDVEAINKARIFADHANEEQAKKHAQNVVRLAATDQLESEIITNKTRAYLSCESGEMIVKINFTEPFRGVGYADYDRSSPCKFYGDGGKYYEMRIPLKGCGTKQEAPRIFINNIILRFHRSLELEEDEIKTIICRYPPPLAPPPPLIAAPILEQPPVAAPFIPAKLSELELLLIVSALLFLTLLLLGIGIGYYCLKKRKVKVVRKFVPPAEIPYFPPPSISSEEHSIISEQSVVQRDDYQFQNMGYIPEAKLSYLDDMFYHDQDMIDDDVMLTQQNYMVPAVSQFQTKKFDDRFVTQASETDIDTDFEVDRLIVPRKPKITKLITEDYFLTPKTTTEIVDEITTHRVVVPPKKTLTTKRLDDTFITPKNETEVDDLVSKQKVFGPPKLITKKVDDLYGHSESETEVIDDQTKHRVFAPKPKPPSTIQEQDDYFRTDIYEIDEVIDDVRETEIHPKVVPPPPPPTTRIVQTTEDDEIVMHSKDVEEVLVDETTTKYHHHPGPGTVLQPKPKITVQNIDDFYVTNITETETNEQITKIGRSMPNLTLQVDFEEQEQLEQEETTRTSRLTGFDVKMRTIPRKKAPTTTSTSYTTTSETITSSTTKIDEVLKVLENPPREKLTGLDEHFMLPTRNRFRQVIITDETFRSLIMESTTIDEYVEKIQMNPSYGPLFEPPTWNVIFRLLSLPEVQSPRKPRGRYSDTYRSGVSAHEVRSVTEEDVTFTRSRLSGSHYVPLPDYPMDDDEPSPRMTTKDKPPGPVHPHWASWLPDPRHYERHSPEFSPITPAFGATRYGPSVRRRTSPTSPPSSRSSGVFGPRRLENPYTSMDSPSVSRRRIFDYDIRPYSPDLDALSLEPSQTYLAYSGSIRHKKNQQQVVEREEREEIKSTTETNVYDWKRWAS